MKGRLVAVLLLITTGYIYALEEIPVSLRVGGYNHNFFKIMEEENKKYVSFPMFLKTIQGSSYSKDGTIEALVSSETKIKIDTRERSLLFLGKKFYYGERDLISLNKDTYISLEILSIFGEVIYDEGMLDLRVTPYFRLNHEIEEAREKERRMLTHRRSRKNDTVPEGEIIHMEDSPFSLGRVKINYENNDLGRGWEDDTFSAALNNRIAYGDFYTSAAVDRGVTWDTWRLTYDHLLEGKELVIGDSYTQNDRLINSEIRGVGISAKNSFTAQYGRTTVTGYAPTGSIVELYKNNRLYAYQTAKESRYAFEDLQVSSTTDLRIRVYDERGNYTERSVTIKSFSEIQEAGKWDYQFNYGENREIHKNQLDLNLLYGVSQDLTIGGGFHQIAAEQIPPGEKEFAEGIGIWRNGGNILPFTVKSTLQQNLSTKEVNTYNEIKSRVLEQNLSLEYNDYSYVMSNLHREFNLRLDSSLGNYSYNTSYYKKYFTGSTDNHFDIEGTRYFDKYYITLKGEREWGDDIDSYGFNTRFNISLKEYSLLLESYQQWNHRSERSDEISIRAQNYASRSPIDLSFFYKTNLDDEYEVGLDLSYDFDNTIYELLSGVSMLLGFTSSEEDSKFSKGIRIERTIVLETPLSPTKSTYLDQGWVYGRVFRDENSNGLMDEGEKPLKGSLRSNGVKYRVDENGRYFIDNLRNNEINKIDLGNYKVDPVYRSEVDKLFIRGEKGVGMKLDIPVRKVLSIVGEVLCSDRDILERTYIQMIKDGEVYRETRVEYDGFYMIEEVLADDYELKVVYKGEKDVEIDRESFLLQPGERSFITDADFTMKGREDYKKDIKLDYNVVIN